MTRIILARLAGLCLTLALVFGALAAMEHPSEAQITMKCWKEVCIMDPDTKDETCIREQIPCPPQT